MAWSFQGGRQVLALARQSIVVPTAPSRWLVGLRWAAIAGMLVTTLAAARLVPSLDVTPVYLVLGTLSILNVGWTVLVRWLPVERPGLVTVQIAQDVLALTTVLWFVGGVTNPFACFLSFQIVLAGILGTPRTMLLTMVLTVVAAAVLSTVPALSLVDAPMGEQRLESLAEMVALAALGIFTGFFVFIYAQRLETFREAMARSEKLAALGRTLGSMAHELNTPLGTILLAGKELNVMGQEANNAEMTQLSATLVDEAQRASDIIALLRGTVRPDARREALDVCSFVPTYVENELNRLKFRGERVIRVTQPLHAFVIRAALCRVITNVLSNAVDAMGRESQKGRVEVDVWDGGASVGVSIKDNGPGIQEDLLPRLGEPFQTTKEDTGGTGLGLYVSGLLAEKMGATLQLESKPGDGTRVTLNLQRARAEETA